MKRRFKNLLLSIVFIATGFAIWKTFSKPLPTPETMPEMSGTPAGKPDRANDFQAVDVGERRFYQETSSGKWTCI